jgi:hypothetical protein
MRLQSGLRKQMLVELFDPVDRGVNVGVGLKLSAVGLKIMRLFTCMYVYVNFIYPR